MITLHALGNLLGLVPLVADESGRLALLAAGPVAGGMVYAGLFTYYRNTDKSNQFERETRVEAQPVTGSDTKINEVRGTDRENIAGDNRNNHRERVQRVQ